ncbi:putative ATP-dependent helicase DinG [Vibrio aerogenes CECT 7868]|uniref:ATP-dependent DNA helicase DinG n=1 Tax=Vibrio aerogenes CECT 7868 TaxID=1216006 RepID=A0A1M5X7C4_9VIBR|nr:ATP-dependent DNA helicase DinG [Vibrio aerogenes]SHH95699.1 putative ATP-dependent helicase DinG [Vibrio aerogenes CECT 7868]
MLTRQIQESIRKSYQNLQIQMDKFIPRRGQNYLIAEIAKTLCGSYHEKNRMLVAEAGTGIGKSLSYLMGAVPVAILNNKSLIISTATVALQEQLVNKDLPLYRRLSDLEFQFRIAKGRQRYCCLEKLASVCSQDSSQASLFIGTQSDSNMDLFQHMYDKLSAGKWDGDIDNWEKPVDTKQWQLIVSDKQSCNAAFSAHRKCPFHQARAELSSADIIIANHSLVMADADLGGGVILPEPEQSIYVFDEAHHLYHVAREHAAASASLKGAAGWLETLNQSAGKWIQLTDEQRAFRFKDEISKNIQVLIPSLNQISQQIIPEQFEDGSIRFEHGELPAWLADEAVHLKKAANQTYQATGKIADLISERIKEGELSSHQSAPVLAELSFFLQRLDNLARVWTMMAEPDRENGAPLARWLSINEEHPGDYVVNVSPIEIGWKLDQQLWSRCSGAIAVSATLRALNSFSFFCHQSGISLNDKEGTRFLALSSPFDFAKKGQLFIPHFPAEPQSPEYTQELIKHLPQYIEERKANLILFSSYWQMNQVAEKLQILFKKNGWLCQVQGEKPRTKILQMHSQAISKQKTSILFGTNSFSEGLDLPGNLLKNVVITKIPFSVPTSPVEQAHAEYIESRGGNPFMQITVPEASRKLIQAVGRLLRNENDSGRVVILDRRIITKWYGKALLDALPPFQRIIGTNE